MGYSRRGFVAGAVALIGAGPLAARAALACAPESRAAVVGFHADRPYWDTSGTALPYRPPHGACAGAGLEPPAGADFIGQFGYC